MFEDSITSDFSITESVHDTSVSDDSFCYGRKARKRACIKSEDESDTSIILESANNSVTLPTLTTSSKNFDNIISETDTDSRSSLSTIHRVENNSGFIFDEEHRCNDFVNESILDSSTSFEQKSANNFTLPTLLASEISGAISSNLISDTKSNTFSSISSIPANNSELPFVKEEHSFHSDSNSSVINDSTMKSKPSRQLQLSLTPLLQVRRDLWVNTRESIICIDSDSEEETGKLERSSSESNSLPENDDKAEIVYLEEPIKSQDLEVSTGHTSKYIIGKHSQSDSPFSETEGFVSPTPVVSQGKQHIVSPVKNFKVQSAKVECVTPITMERKGELEAELIRLTSYRDQALEEYHIHKATQNSLDLNSLPDHGLKLMVSARKMEKNLKELSERIGFVNQVLKKSPVMETNQGAYLENIEHVDPLLPSQHINLSEMGKMAMATYKAQSAMTLEALQRMHASLETKEEESCEPPRGLRVELMAHQVTGLSWLLRREQQHYPSGGILADDMGLGKTLTMIALILKSNNKERQDSDCDSDSDDDSAKGLITKCEAKGGTLVVCPSSVMGQWETELKSRVKPGTLTHVLHHGAKRETRPSRLARYDIVLTTYAIMQKEDGKGGPLLRIKWDRIILDEAHTIRNMKSLTAKSIFLLQGKNRWCLTGTPVHNKQTDLYSLMKFLHCRPFDDLAVWKRWVDNKDAAGQDRLNCIMKSIMLRRTKDSIENLGLRSKNFHKVVVKLDTEEKSIYEKLLQFSRTLFAKFLHQKAEKENMMVEGLHISRNKTIQENPFDNHPELNRLYSQMMNIQDVKTFQILMLLLRLRQLCCHPSLIVSMFNAEDMKEERNTQLVDEEGTDLDVVERIVRMSMAPSEEEDVPQPSLSVSNPVFKKSRVSSKLRCVMEHFEEKILPTEDKALIVSQFTSVLNLVANILNEQNIKYCSLTGSTPVAERASIIEKFNRSGSAKVMLLSLTAGGTGLNLVGANHILLIEPHWNPQLERQAFDRIYRTGQKKDCYIYKFICEMTIEEQILKVQDNKLAIADDILTGSKNVAKQKLTIQDLKTLFS